MTTLTTRDSVRKATIEWIAGQNPTLYMTLNFNRERHRTSVDKAFKTTMARMDRLWLGPNWSRFPSAERTWAIGFIEHPNSNVHIHALIRPPAVAGDLDMDLLRFRFRRDWRQVCRSGTIDLQPVTRVEGVASYITKSVSQNLDSMLLSTIYHRSGRRRT